MESICSWGDSQLPNPIRMYHDDHSFPMRKRSPIPTRSASSRQEKKVARQLGGRVQPNSGATDFLKGDVIAQGILIECKTVMKPRQSVSLKKEWFVKNDQERFAAKLDYSAIAFDFGDGGEQYIAMSMSQFKRLMEDRDESE